MRIISGKARGTKLFTLEGTDTRPTLDRVKESLFNILNFKLQDAIVLDLFAGSGALGLESISRGAQRVILGENNKNAIEIIEKNIAKTKFKENTLLIYGDYKKTLAKISEEHIKCDIVFIDPPYKTELVKDSLKDIIKSNILNEKSILVVETDEPERIQKDIDDLNFEIFDKRKYGRVTLFFLNRKG